MKKIFFLFLLIASFASAQTPTGIKTRFPGIWYQSKDTASETAADSLAVLWQRSDSSLYLRAKGYWKKIAANSTGGYLQIIDTANMLSHYPNYTATNSMLNLKLDKSDSTLANRVTSNRNFLNNSLPLKVDKTTTVNSYPLSSNITLTKSDFDLSNVDNTSDANKPVSMAQATSIATKQAVLVSGTNIKTLNGNSLLGSGDIGVASAIGFTPENVSNKSNSTSLGYSAALYPTQNAVKVYVDAAVANGNTAYGWGNYAAASHYIGTTLIANNRASGAIALTGITSIDGQAATVVTNANLTGVVTSVGNATSIAAGVITNAMLAGSIDLTTKVTGILPIANGGTGSATKNFVDLTTTQTVAGSKSFTVDMTVSGLTLGLGGGSRSTNTVVGVGAIAGTSTQDYNSAFGNTALNKLSNGIYNTGIGALALGSTTTGIGNTGVGFEALYYNNTLSYNSAFGHRAGMFLADGTTINNIASNSLYLGANTKAAQSANTNEIVIGYNLTGLGSNTTILGNSSTVTTAIQGNLILGSTVTNGIDKLQITGTQKINGQTLTIANTLYTSLLKLEHTANATTVITGGTGAENITFGPSNRIFLNASQVYVSYLGNVSTLVGPSLGGAAGTSMSIGLSQPLQGSGVIQNLTSITGNVGQQNASNEANILIINPVIDQAVNYTSGKVRGIYYNPTLTNLRSTNHIALEIVTGNNLFNSTSGNTNIGYSTDQGYKLAVNGTLNVASALTGTTSTMSGFSYAHDFAIGTSDATKARFRDGTTFIALDTWNGTTYSLPIQIQGSTAAVVNASNQGLVIDGSGNSSFYGSVTATSFVKSGGTSSQFLMADGSVSTAATTTSGTYTPTVTNISNTSSLFTNTAQYLRVGNTVTVSGYVNGTCTASASNEFELTLPVASALTAAEQCAGVAVTTQTGIVNYSCPIRAGVTNDKASFSFYSPSVTAFAFYYTYTYRVL